MMLAWMKLVYSRHINNGKMLWQNLFIIYSTSRSVSRRKLCKKKKKKTSIRLQGLGHFAQV